MTSLPSGERTESTRPPVERSPPRRAHQGRIVLLAGALTACGAPDLTPQFEAILNPPSPAACTRAYDTLLRAPNARAFLTERFETATDRPRDLAMWMLADLQPPPDPAAIAAVAITPWKAGGKPGARPPLQVRLACETLQRLGSTAGAIAVAESGIAGYYLRGCVPLLVQHGGTHPAVLATLVTEATLRPNGHQVLTGLAARGDGALLAALLTHEATHPPPDDEPLSCPVPLVLETMAETGPLTAVLPAIRAALDGLTDPSPAVAECLDATKAALTTPSEPDPDTARPTPNVPPTHGPFCQ